MRVAVLPTGRTEWQGLGVALDRLFPGHEFYSVPTSQEVSSNPNRFPYDGFTSLKLTDAHERAPPDAAKDLVARAAQEALGDRKRAAADLVLVVDDVELVNAEQPGRVVSVMRKAVETHLCDLQLTAHHKRTREMLRSKVSFHLIAPMIEAWFFADRQALTQAGVPANAAICFDKETDPEAFETADSAYLAATELACPALAALPQSKKKKLRPKWLGELPRGRHPKGYLQWLCRAPGECKCTSYHESEKGGRALGGIRWESLFARSEMHFQFLRSLVEDLEDGLGCSPATAVTGKTSHLTARSSLPDAVLRNI